MLYKILLIDSTKTYVGYSHTFYMDNSGINFCIIYKKNKYDYINIYYI